MPKIFRYLQPITNTLVNLLTQASNGSELLEALEYLALDESQGWEEVAVTDEGR